MPNVKDFCRALPGLKYFNVFGPNENHKGYMQSLVHKAFHQIRETGHVSLFRSYRPEFGDGEQRRDFLYVKDAAEISVSLAETIDGGGLFNIGSGQANTWMSLVEAIFAALALPPQIDFIEMPELLRGKYQYFTCADVSKLRSVGYGKPVTPLVTRPCATTCRTISSQDGNWAKKTLLKPPLPWCNETAELVGFSAVVRRETSRIRFQIFQPRSGVVNDNSFVPPYHSAFYQTR